jgi:hypothetical protein
MRLPQTIDRFFSSRYGTIAAVLIVTYWFWMLHNLVIGNETPRPAPGGWQNLLFS